MSVQKSPVMLVAALFVMLCSTDGVYAQKIYVLAVGDTQDPKIGESDAMDLGTIYSAFSSNVPPNQLEFYSQDTENSAWNGPEIDLSANPRGAILDALARCPAGTGDTIVFYWSGHGAYDSGGHYLVMPNRAPFYRTDLLAAIRGKSPRLAVIISDACNTRFDSRRLTPPSEMAPAAPEEISPLFHELFIRHRGVVDINASSEGEEAIAIEDCGGLFTAALASDEMQFDEFGEPTGRGIEIEVRQGASTRSIKIPPGFFTKYYSERRTWQDLVSHVNRTVRTYWHAQTSQTVRVWSLPRRPPSIAAADSVRGLLSLTRGDVILTINGHSIADEGDCRRAVRNSPDSMEFTVRDSRDGTVWRMQTTLRRRTPRFGTYLDDQPGGGALVTGVMWGSACTRNEVLGEVENGLLPEAGPLGNVRPEAGDVIVEVNGKPIRTRQECIDAVNRSPDVMEFVTRGKRTGGLFKYRTRLRSSGTRFGVGLADTGGNGARITSLSHGYPCTQCKLLR